MAESTIRAGDPVVVLVNVFTCEPQNQQQLLDAWAKGTEEVMRYLPGFISANLHRSLDGTKVINYAQWASRDAFEASLRDPEVREYFGKLAQIAPPDPVLAEVVSVHRAASRPD
jgi:quinol monooxygenase YgiN